MTASAPVNRYLRVVPLRVSPGHSPPSGPAIQWGKKLACVVGDRMLGRSAAITTTSALQATMISRAATPIRTCVLARESTLARPPGSSRRSAARGSPIGVSRRGNVLASLDMREGLLGAPQTAEGPPKRALRD